MGQRLPIDTLQKTADPNNPAVLVKCWLVAGQYIEAYFSTAAAADDNELTVWGLMYDVDEFNKVYGAEV